MSWLEPDDVMRDVEALEAEMGVPEGFFKRLAAENDWSFIVQLHALVESSLAHAILLKLADKRLEEFVTKLNVGNHRAGKLGLAAALELVSKADQEFVMIVSEFRNRLVHDARQATFSLAEHFRRLPDSKAESYYHRWGFAKTEDKGPLTFLEIFRAAPKVFFHVRAFYFLAALYLKAQPRGPFESALAEAVAKAYARR
jgi:hypothetical protein